MTQPTPAPPSTSAVVSILAYRRARRVARSSGWPLCLERCQARSAGGPRPPADVIDLSVRRDPAS